MTNVAFPLFTLAMTISGFFRNSSKALRSSLVMLLGGGFAFLTMLQTAALAAHAAPLSRCRHNAGSTPAMMSIVGILVGNGAKFSPCCRTRCLESFSSHDDKLTIHLCPLLRVRTTDLFRPSSSFLRRASSLEICFSRCARNVASPRFSFYACFVTIVTLRPARGLHNATGSNPGNSKFHTEIITCMSVDLWILLWLCNGAPNHGLEPRQFKDILTCMSVALLLWPHNGADSSQWIAPRC